MQLRANLHSRVGSIVYTPFEIADAVTQLALRSLKKGQVRVLEPSAGEGAFLASLKKLRKRSFDITAVDIDGNAIKHIKTMYDHVTAIESDYLYYVSQEKGGIFDLIIGNPPYIRRHNFTQTFSEQIVSLSERVSYPIGKLKNAWAAFTLASIEMLSDDGTLAFVVPYELMTVVYGQFLQDRLIQEFHRVEIFVPDEKAFKKIGQDAVAFVGSKRATGDAGLHIHRVKSLSDLEPLSSKLVDFSNTKNLSIELKSFLFDSETTELLHSLRKRLNVVYDFCDSTSGIVTAANDFFILSRENVECFGLQRWARRILKKGSFLSSGPEFTTLDFQKLEDAKPCYLIDFCQDGIDRFPRKAREYIKRGEDQRLNMRYKCRNREPWFRIPIVPASDGIFFKRSHQFPRLCSNEAHILVTDTAYQVRMRSGFEIQNLTYSFYNSLTLLFSEMDGRFYSGGVLELTPSEFKGLPLVYHVPTKSEYISFVNRFPIAASGRDDSFAAGDDWLRGRLKLSKSQMKKIQSALFIVRNHRLRHGVSDTG